MGVPEGIEGGDAGSGGGRDDGSAEGGEELGRGLARDVHVTWSFGERGRTSSCDSSSLAISRRRRAPSTSVELIIIAISPFSTSTSTSPFSRNPHKTTSSSQSTTMAPFVETFPASALPFRSEITEKNKRRKDFSGENLKGCDLLEMLQYDCGIEGPVTRGSVVICRPVVRLFRR